MTKPRLLEQRHHTCTQVRRFRTAYLDLSMARTRRPLTDSGQWLLSVAEAQPFCMRFGNQKPPRKRNALRTARSTQGASGGSSAGPSVASAWIASRLAPHGGRPRQRDTSGQPGYPDGTAAASRRSQRPAGPSYPDGAETERARPRSRSPADFACSPRPRSVRCEPEIRTACILAKLALGSRMPQDAPGAVGGHGCRRRR